MPVGNYAGDNMNVKMAIKMATRDGLEVATVVANDDVCSAPPAEREKRRGVAGEILMWKIGGAKAALGGSLRCARRGAEGDRELPFDRVGLGPCTLPRSAIPILDRARNNGGRHR